MALELKRDAMVEHTYEVKGETVSSTHFDTRAMGKQLEALERFRDEGLFKDPDWEESVQAIMDFQHTDGSFCLCTDQTMPMDCRIPYVLRPSYACCQVLMQVALFQHPCTDERLLEVLGRGLDFCSQHMLHSPGRKGVYYLRDFGKSGARAARMVFPDLAPQFFDELDKLCAQCAKRVRDCDVFHPIQGTLMAEDLMAAAESMGYDEDVAVFVYGTLMRGMENAHLL